VLWRQEENENDLATVIFSLLLCGMENFVLNQYLYCHYPFHKNADVVQKLFSSLN